MTSWLELNIEPTRWIYSILRHLVTDNSGNKDGGGGNSDARCSSSKADSHNTDTVGSNDMVGSSDRAGSSRNRGTHTHNPETRTLFLQIRQRQNVAPERKRFPLPPVQLREVFSSSLLFYLPDIKQVDWVKVSPLFRSDFSSDKL